MAAGAQLLVTSVFLEEHKRHQRRHPGVPQRHVHLQSRGMGLSHMPAPSCRGGGWETEAARAPFWRMQMALLTGLCEKAGLAVGRQCSASVAREQPCLPTKWGSLST